MAQNGKFYGNPDNNTPDPHNVNYVQEACEMLSAVTLTEGRIKVMNKQGRRRR
jgi:hypothetical protein